MVVTFEIYRFKIKMNTDEIVTAGSISSKIYAFFILVAVEIICNSLTFFYNLSPDGLL